MSARYLVVDGHSVIFSWPELRRLHEQNRAAARKALTDRLGLLHDAGAWRVTLVFDGKLGGTVQAAPVPIGAMVVSYASADQTADSIIERLVAGSGVAAEILVITADEAEKRTVEALGATTASPDWLRIEADRGEASFSSELEKVHRGARWK